MTSELPLIIAVTGASGVQYAYDLIQSLDLLGHPYYLVFSSSAKTVIEIETDLTINDFSKKAITVFDPDNLGASIASGSFPVKGMVIVPCSLKTLGLIAHGIDLNLIARAAHVQLKEGRKLVLVIRETPYSLPLIENMRLVKLAGATILPASPGFYHKPKSIADMLHFITGKILDQFNIDHDFKKWRGI